MPLDDEQYDAFGVDKTSSDDEADSSVLSEEDDTVPAGDKSNVNAESSASNITMQLLS